MRVWIAAAALALLAIGLSPYLNAVGVHHAALRSGPSPCAYDGTYGCRIRHEVCSWMDNRGDSNDRRRSALAGLGVWYVVAAALGAWAAARGLRTVDRWRWPRRLLAAGYLLLLLMLVWNLPRAYAIGRWGLKYPRVVAITEACHPTPRTGEAAGPDALTQLADAARAGRCQVLRVTDRATGDMEVVIHRGDECPAAADGSKRGSKRIPRQVNGQACPDLGPEQAFDGGSGS